MLDKTMLNTHDVSLTIQEFFSIERFQRHNIRVKFTRARILNFLECRCPGSPKTLGEFIEVIQRHDLSLGTDFGKSSYDSMVTFLHKEGIELPHYAKPTLHGGVIKKIRREMYG
jgi:hypothetical protein